MKKLIAASRLFPGRSPMKITRRFAVASLLVIAVAIVLGAPAPASAQKHQQAKLYPAADGPFPHASGTVTVYPVDFLWSPCRISVSVSKLAPNASYYMPVKLVGYFDYWGFWHEGEVSNVPIQTDARGSGKIGSVLCEYCSCQVYDSSGTLVLTYSKQ